MRCEDLSKERLISEIEILRQENADLRSEIEDHLKRRLRYEKMVADISSLAIASEDSNLFQQKCLEIAGKTLALSRTYIFEHRHETDMMDNTFEWFAPGISPQKEHLQGLPTKEAPWWVEMMRSNRIINCSDIEELPYEAERNILRNQQIKSVLVVPLFVKRAYYGFMGFDECRLQREWPTEDVALLKTISEIIGMVLEREEDRHALIEKEALLSATIESMPFGLVIIGKDGRFSIINSTARQWGHAVGKRPGEVVMDEEILSRWRENSRRAFSGETVREEIQYNAGGKTQSFHNIISPVRIGNEVNAVVGISIDITDQQLMEEKLKASEKRYRELLENMSEVLYVIDRSGRISYICPAIWSLAQYRPSEVIGRYAEDFIYKEDLPLYRENLKDALAGKSFTGNEYRIVTGSGDIRWVETSTRPVHVGNEIIEVQGLLLDITERKQAEEALRKNEALLSATEQLTKVGGWEWDIEKQAMFWTEEVYRIHDLEPDEVTPGSPEHIARSIQCYDPAARSVIEAAFRRCAETGESYDLEFPFTTAKGRQLWIRTTARPVLENQKIEKVVGNIMDITEWKKVEEELRIAKEELEVRVQTRTAELKERAGQLARLSSQLTLAEQRERRRLAVILHDHLQQLLVGAKIELELLAIQLGNENQSCDKAYNLLVESIKTSQSLSTQMAPYILYERGLASGLEWLAKTMEKTYKLEIETQIDPNVPVEREDIKVLLFESVRELLFNVVKHARASSARIEMGQDDNHLHITITDQGVGFDIDKVTTEIGRERFGLFSIRERLELIGGNLKIESSPGHETVFSLILPMSKATSSEEPGVTSECASGEATAASIHPGQRIRVLLADDHVVMRQGLSSLLHGHSDIDVVGEAADGEEAVQATRQFQPDVILLDVSMPKMNGVEVTRVIHSEFPHIRIIGLSMYDDFETETAMLEEGAAAFLSKSGHSDVLLTAIRGSACEKPA
jgi:PAS domain S-box-containing protein